MVKRIEWTKKAITELHKTLDYLKNEFSQNTSERFLDLVEKHVEGIKRHPSKGRLVSKRKTIRFILLGKNHRCYYRVQGTILYITALFDTRQDSAKRPYS